MAKRMRRHNEAVNGEKDRERQEGEEEGSRDNRGARGAVLCVCVCTVTPYIGLIQRLCLDSYTTS